MSRHRQLNPPPSLHPHLAAAARKTPAGRPRPPVEATSDSPHAPKSPVKGRSKSPARKASQPSSSRSSAPARPLTVTMRRERRHRKAVQYADDDGDGDTDADSDEADETADAALSDLDAEEEGRPRTAAKTSKLSPKGRKPAKKSSSADTRGAAPAPPRAPAFAPQEDDDGFLLEEDPDDLPASQPGTQNAHNAALQNHGAKTPTKKRGRPSTAVPKDDDDQPPAKRRKEINLRDAETDDEDEVEVEVRPAVPAKAPESSPRKKATPFTFLEDVRLSAEMPLY